MIYRSSEYFVPTLKETPLEAEIASHRLLLRAGMIQQIALGVYTWLPLGLRVVRAIEAVVREEMEAVGCHELLMPGVQPAALWQQSGRWEAYGKELLRFTDRHERAFCLGPTHEEVVTSLIKNRIRSYQDLPLALFQIQTKFRDEIRPRFGVMRAREFIMKDAYSFHADEQDLNRYYHQMEEAYHTICRRLGLEYRAVDADSGSIGGARSREFHVLTPSGEDLLVTSTASDYAANIEMAECPLPPTTPAATQTRALVDTPHCVSVEEATQLIGCDLDQCLKLLVVHKSDSTAKEPRCIALALRGGDQLNTIKAQKIPEIASPLRFAEPELLSQLGLPIGSMGPCDLPLDVIADNAALGMADFACGANQPHKHYTGVNWGRDCTYVRVADIRNIRENETCPDGGQAVLTRGSEIGHIFQLGDKYTRTIDAKAVDASGKQFFPLMGCYGIGVTRIVAAHIEQSHDEQGIIWNKHLHPFAVHLLQLSGVQEVRQTAQTLAQRLHHKGYSALLEDRPLRPGVMFSQADLLGFPLQMVVSERNLAQGKIEIKERSNGEKHMLAKDEVLPFVEAFFSR